MLSKTEVVDKIEAMENGAVHVRTCTRIIDDGKIIASSFHRHVVTPGEDYSSETERVRSICAALHTPECIAAYKAAAAQQGA